MFYHSYLLLISAVLLSLPAQATNPCAKVETLAKAKRCMNFWAKELFASSEDGNPTNVVVSNETTQRMLSEVMSANGATRQAIGHAVETARNSQFLAYLGTFHQGKFSITYFALDTNNTLRPTQVFTLKTEQTKRWSIEMLFGEQGMTPKEILKGYTCAVLLGGKASQHNGFADYIDDITDNFHGR